MQFIRLACAVAPGATPTPVEWPLVSFQSSNRKASHTRFRDLERKCTATDRRTADIAWNSAAAKAIAAKAIQYGNQNWAQYCYISHPEINLTLSCRNGGQSGISIRVSAYSQLIFQLVQCWGNSEANHWWFGYFLRAINVLWTTADDSFFREF